MTRSWLAGQEKLVTACRAAAAVLETRARTLDASRDRPAARDFSEQVAALLGPAAETAGQAGQELTRDLLRLRFLALYYLILIELGDSVPQAVAAGEALTADLERMLGADHPDTLNARNSLAAAYLSAGRPADAIPLFERTLAEPPAAIESSAEPAAVQLPPADLPEAVTETLPAGAEPEPLVIAAGEPAAGEPAVEEPAALEIFADWEPVPWEPAAWEAGEPDAVDEPAVADINFTWASVAAKLTAPAQSSRQEFAHEEPAVEKHAAPEPAAEEPVAEEPRPAGSAVSEPAVGLAAANPGAEEAATEEPAVGEPDASGPAGRRVRLPWVAAAVVALLVASGAAGVLSQLHGGGHAPARSAAPAKPADAAQLAADWVAQQVSRTVTVACDPLMCAALEARGVPTARLLVLRTSAASPHGAAVVVATPAVRSQFGSRLDTAYAPAVIAGFGSGPGQVNVQVVAPDGAAAYRAELRQDQAARKTAGTQLLANKQIQVTAPARAQLAVGGVDSRLLIMLPALAAAHPVQVLAFGAPGPKAGPGIGLCSADLSGSSRVAGMSDTAYQSWLTSFVRAQLTHFTGTVAVVRLGGQPIVRVVFAMPSPLGLLAA